MRTNAPAATVVAATVGGAVAVGGAILATVLALTSGLPLAVVAFGWGVVVAIAVLEVVATAYWTELGLGVAAQTAELETVRVEVAELCDALEIAAPRVEVLDVEYPSAMVAALPGFGRLYVTAGLLEAASPAERRALLAHELGHVVHRDGLVTALIGAAANAVGLAVFWWWALAGASTRAQLVGVALFELCYLLRSFSPALLVASALGGLAPLVVGLALPQVSRYQEYRADAVAASLVADPRRVVRCLSRLDLHGRTVAPIGRLRWERGGADEGVLDRLLADHPPYSRRVDRLLATAEEEK